MYYSSKLLLTLLALTRAVPLLIWEPSSVVRTCHRTSLVSGDPGLRR